jgi:F-type H+-transporting ATPase subunit alpha
VEEQVLIIFALTNGYLDDIEIKDITRFEQQYLEFMRTSRAKLVQELKNKKDIPEGLEKKIRKAVEDFKESFSA